MNSDILKIGLLHHEDIDEAMKLVLDESWNQTERDWQLFIANPNNVCLKAEINGKLVATATAICYANRIAWIGMVLVNREQRGKGIATMLMTTILNELKSYQSVKLDATPAGEHVYKKIGFVGEYKIYRMVNTSVNFDWLNGNFSASKNISEQDYSQIFKFDKKVFGVNRDNLIYYLMQDFPQVARLEKQNDKIAGFSLGRQGNKYFQIGPVSANSYEMAKSLIGSALFELEGQSVVVDVLADKTELVGWLEEIGFKKKREFIRMYSHSNPFIGKQDSQFLICGPEFG